MVVAGKLEKDDDNMNNQNTVTNENMHQVVIRFF